MPFTTADLIAMQARLSPKRVTSPDAVADESELAEDIRKFCVSKGWLICRARTDRRSTIPVGWPDFSIFRDAARPVFAELKRKNGKVSTEQLGTISHLRKLGYVAGIVDSMSSFLELIKQ